MKRISDEAVAQGAPLTQEDLGVLLFMDRGTVADHTAVLEAREETILTRSHFTDAGRAVTHKRPIIQLCLLGVPETEIARRTGHTLSSAERYIYDLLRVALPPSAWRCSSTHQPHHWFQPLLSHTLPR